MDCPRPDKGLNFDCNAFKNDLYTSWTKAFEDNPYMHWYVESYWCSKGQELRSFNEQTKESERWIATKDILDLKDIHCKYLERQEEIVERKLITAQTNFEWLNQA